MSPTIRVLAAVLASFGAGLIGYMFVDSGVSSWYAGLTKPALTPSDSTFAVVWLILYGLMAAALAIVWTSKPHPEYSEGWIRFFFVQLLFNASYTMFFFGFHAVFIAFVDLLFLAFTVLCLTTTAAEIDKRAAYLLTPYLLWILFAAYLTLGIWWLN